LPNIFLLVVDGLLPYDPGEGIFKAIDVGGFFDPGDDGDIVGIVKLIIVHLLLLFSQFIMLPIDK
jgi:hypothetical protein